jgi:uncharacterized protein (TIRG00374 family)
LVSTPSKEPPRLSRHWPKLVVSLVIAVGFAWLMHQGALPLVPHREAFARVDWFTVFLYVCFWSAVHVVRTGRWYWLLAAVHRVPLITVLRASFIGAAAVVLMPFRTGEFVRPLLIRREGKLSAWAATGTVGAERIIDGLSVMALLILSLALAKPVEPLPDHIGDLQIPAKLVPGAAYATALLFITAFALMSVFYWWRDWARRVTRSVLGLVSLDLAEWVSGRVEQVADGLGFLREPRYSLPFLAATLVYWLGNGFSWWILAQAVGIERLTVLQGFATMGVLGLGILIPGAPGFFGAFQLAIYAGLAMYLPPEEVVGQGSVYVFLTYVVQVGITLTAGLIGLSLRPAEADAPKVEDGAPAA